VDRQDKTLLGRLMRVTAHPVKRIQMGLAVLTVASLIALAVACTTSEIIIPHRVDVQPLASLKVPAGTVTFERLPPPAKVIAARGMNLYAQSPQLEGISEWIRYDNQKVGLSTNDLRQVEIDLYLFRKEEEAESFMVYEGAHHLYNPRVDKYTKGGFANGITYCASYLVQHRADPEGASLPMSAYSSFLIIRAGHVIAIVDVYEIHTHHPRGVTTTEVDFVAKQLTQLAGGDRVTPRNN
jgi:hypothetical protein